eukprot:gene10410-12783_t
MFTKLEIVSRWIIFTIDICLSIFAIAFAVVLQHNFNTNNINPLGLYKAILLVIAVNSLVFYSVKTFAGIVRYTSAQDSFRILFSVILSSLILFFVHTLITIISGAPLVSNVAIIIYTLFSFLVIIYGAGEAGGKTIDGVRILDAAQLEHLIVKHEVDEIIFASYTIPLERKNQIVDICLENDVKILNIPSPEVWAKGDVTTAQIQNINIEDLLNRKTIEIDIDGIQNQLKGKRILITGAAGSIGSEIVRQLLKFQTGLIILCDQSETALHHIYLELEENHANTNFHAFVGDVKDEKRMQFLFETYKPHYVYHAAAYKHVPLMEDNASEAIKTNVSGTKTIADLSVKHGVQKFVMISTDKAVNPTNVMGASKRIAEIYVQSLNNSLNNPNVIFSNGLSYLNSGDVKPITKFITTRFGNVLGSNGSVIPRFKQQIEKGGPVTVTHPEITRYFMTIPEACRLVLEAGCMGKGGEIFVFDMGKSVKIIELAKKMIRLAGLIPNQDIKIAYSGLRPGEKLFEELLNDSENTMPTHHEKIMIGQVREYIFNEIENQIYQLLSYAGSNNNRQVVQQMKLIVPEFKSKNSVFEELDVTTSNS